MKTSSKREKARSRIHQIPNDVKRSANAREEEAKKTLSDQHYRLVCVKPIAINAYSSELSPILNPYVFAVKSA